MEEFVVDIAEEDTTITEYLYSSLAEAEAQPKKLLGRLHYKLVKPKTEN